MAAYGKICGTVLSTFKIASSRNVHKYIFGFSAYHFTSVAHLDYIVQAVAIKHISNVFVDMANFHVGFLCCHEVIRNVDIEQEVIQELVAAWREADTILLPILVKIGSASSAKRILLRNFLLDHSILAQTCLA